MWSSVLECFVVSQPYRQAPLTVNS